ncbi:uncharacterized protein LOC106079864 isoform X3 [Biomphalaria glabrata]|uniref:Uncharacterized protein LOC106079864 isoform X3 n=1 Tax=Biomphalaria glabrata TaxID=6526 RepID=A0A9W3BHD3_BIOGL|nr:uncharacterized protein LOC106079864 isoform X3 [Biomphalaria glabrata]
MIIDHESCHSKFQFMMVIMVTLVVPFTAIGWHLYFKIFVRKVETQTLTSIDLNPDTIRHGSKSRNLLAVSEKPETNYLWLKCRKQPARMEDMEEYCSLDMSCEIKMEMEENEETEEVSHKLSDMTEDFTFEDLNHWQDRKNFLDQRNAITNEEIVNHIFLAPESKESIQSSIDDPELHVTFALPKIKKERSEDAAEDSDIGNYIHISVMELSVRVSRRLQAKKDSLNLQASEPESSLNLLVPEPVLLKNVSQNNVSGFTPNAIRYRRHREKLQADPEKFAAYKEKDRKRSVVYRQNITQEKRERARLLSNLRTQKCRQKKKELGLPLNEKKVKPETRAAVLERREKERLRKAAYRAKLSPHKKAWINRKRKERKQSNPESK